MHGPEFEKSTKMDRGIIIYTHDSKIEESVVSDYVVLLERKVFYKVISRLEVHRSVIQA